MDLDAVVQAQGGEMSPMDEEVVVQAQGEEVFDQSTTLKVEERAFDFVVEEEGAQKGQEEYKFFFVVRECYSLRHFVQSYLSLYFVCF